MPELDLFSSINILEPKCPSCETDVNLLDEHCHECGHKLDAIDIT